MSVYVNVVIESRKCKSYKAEAVFCLWYTTPREEVMQDELCCLSVCLHWSHSDNKPTCVTSTARFKLPAGVCVYFSAWLASVWIKSLQHYSNLVNITHSGLLPQLFGSSYWLWPATFQSKEGRKQEIFFSSYWQCCHVVFLLSRCESDSARTPCCSENGRTSWMWRQWTSVSCVVSHWSDSNLWWLWFRYHDRLIDKTIRYIKQLSDNLTPQLSSTPDACVCLGSGPAQWHSVTALQQRCSEVWPADSNFVWLKSFVFPGTIIKTLRKHFNNLVFNSKFCYILYIPNKTLTVK